MITLYDSHAHLDHLEDLDGALYRAQQAGVKGILAMSMDLNSCRSTLEIARHQKDMAIYPALGMHPSETKLEDLDGICELIKEHQQDIVAIGEIGLDFWYKWVRKDDQKKQDQRQAYRTFLMLGKELDLPVVIHSRGAWQECLDIALQVGVTKAEFHWYSGPLDVLEKILEAGFYVSTSPSVAFSPQSKEAMGAAPMDRILIETDCPVYYKNRDTGEGFKAEPKDVFFTLNAMSALKNLDPAEAAVQFNQNAETFFHLKPASQKDDA